MKPLSTEQKMIVERNLGLVGLFVQTHSGPGMETTEVFQIAALALMGAVQTWEPSLGALSSWAFQKMRAALQSTIRRQCLVRGVRPPPRCVSLFDTLDDEGLALEERIADPKAVQPDETANTMRILSVVLPKKRRHREVLQRRAVGFTLQEIGQLLGLTRERVRQIEAVAIKAARRKCYPISKS